MGTNRKRVPRYRKLKKKKGGQGYRIACYQLCLTHTHTPVCTQIPWKDTQALGTVGASAEKGRP